MAKYLAHSSGRIVEQVPITTSAGVADALKLLQTDATGKISSTVLPTGIGADTASINSTEALTAGDLVNVYDVGSGVFGVRRADASTQGKEATGFVISGFASGIPALVYFEGSNTQVTGMLPGTRYLATTPGGSTSTPPSATGNVVQIVGFGTSATVLNFQSEPPITLA